MTQDNNRFVIKCNQFLQRLNDIILIKLEKLGKVLKSLSYNQCGSQETENKPLLAAKYNLQILSKWPMPTTTSPILQGAIVEALALPCCSLMTKWPFIRKNNLSVINIGNLF